MKTDLWNKSFGLSLSRAFNSVILLYVFVVLFLFCSVLIGHSIYAVTVSQKDSKAFSRSKINVYDNKIAFVEPTFTYAAYQNGSFYNFYKLYSPLLYDNNKTIITTNLDLLKNRPIPHGPFPYYEHPSYFDIPYINYSNILLQHVKYNSTQVRNITDVNVHDGKIFQPNGTNAYDILFLFHNEYLTQPEYNNLKHFVLNGGTIVFTDANILTTEVSYNKTTDTITLINGHDWKLNDTFAQKGPTERWLSENKEWMGSNFLNIPSNFKVYFGNNPFNYTHSEEQFVNNPNAKILLDYHAYNLTRAFKNATVATYEMNYGNGKVVNLGIWGHTLVNNAAFINYFDKVIMPIALNHAKNDILNKKTSISKIPFEGKTQ